MKISKSGWAVGDAADFLEMSEAERQLLDARAQMAAAVREARTISRPTVMMKLPKWRITTNESRIWMNRNIKDWTYEAVAVASVFLLCSGLFAFGLALFCDLGFFRATGAAIVAGMISGVIAGRGELAKFQKQYEDAIAEEKQ